MDISPPAGPDARKSDRQLELAAAHGAGFNEGRQKSPHGCLRWRWFESHDGYELGDGTLRHYMPMVVSRPVSSRTHPRSAKSTMILKGHQGRREECIRGRQRHHQHARYSAAEIDFVADDPGNTLFHCHHQDQWEGFAGLITYV
jgi:hypothetical protein